MDTVGPEHHSPLWTWGGYWGQFGAPTRSVVTLHGLTCVGSRAYGQLGSIEGAGCRAKHIQDDNGWQGILYVGKIDMYQILYFKKSCVYIHECSDL